VKLVHHLGRELVGFGGAAGAPGRQQGGQVAVDGASQRWVHLGEEEERAGRLRVSHVFCQADRAL